MKTIHLKCGHNITVREWPSKTGLAKVRHHYKKFHPMRMKKMTKKSVATKRRRGLINIPPTPKGMTYQQSAETKSQAQKIAQSYRNAGFTIKILKWEYGYRIYAGGWGSRKKNIKHNPPGELIYDRLLEIHAQKQHGKFKGENFVHNFKKNTDAVVIGNKDGSLTIKSKKGKRLWKKFNY